MSTKSLPTIALLLSLSTIVHGDLADNAALRYWQAFSAIPEFTEEQNEALADWRTIPLDDKRVAPTIAASESALAQLRSAAELDACDWGLDMSQGFALPLPHLSKSRELMRMACLRARSHLASGRSDAGLRDLRAAAKLAADTGRPPMLICQLVSIAQQNMIIDCLADHAHRLTEKQRAALVRDLPKLSPWLKLSDGMRAERDIAVPWLRSLANNPAKLMAAMRGEQGGGPDLPDGNEGVKMMRKQIDLLEADYNELIAIADGPLDELSETTERIIERADRESRMLTKMMLPSLTAAGKNLRIGNAKTVMLRAGLLYLNGGNDAAKVIADPHGRGGLTIVAGDALTITSNLKDRNGKPVTLTIQTK